MGTEAAVAAAAARARHKVISHFMSQNAVSAANAVPFAPERRMQTRFFDKLREDGVIVPAKNATYWIDVAKLDAYQQSRRKRVGLALGLMATILGAGVAIGLLG